LAQHRLALVAPKKEIAARDIGTCRLKAEPIGDGLEVRHPERALADQIHAAKQRDVRSHAASRRREAWARASSVIDAPDSIRAISSRRSSAESLRTVVRVPWASWHFSIR
jgi:hypothetical protein